MKQFLISIGISSGDYEIFVKRIIDLAKKRTSSYVCVANVHMLMEAQKDADFSKIVNDADICTPDGMPLAKAIKLLYGNDQDRVAGMDLLPDLLKVSEKDALRVYFYGGTNAMQEASAKYVKSAFPNLIATGFHSPPFRPLTNEEESEIIERINATGTNLVFVALGCPKQEKWMASMKGRINACMIGIGGALPVMIGLQERAPVWMQKYSLEWLFRLYQEPGRLWKRYFYTNSLFLLLFAGEYFKIKLLRQNQS
ncbi:WecB/TagA/CpsF family glycosyltransferase [Dyadobacter sp. CY312]|uniref:WecB/TagA/CpsF family glycosyltransferase n=1 Tax=Dyadobacter sp. CY312 TaxID=2907303 RepID=UPI001F3DCD30|nr:WecB/TagA/CpsF family glycosyltransferase [Dyadobacter sp. CY312]MCE7040496.1 WecB/TagA/CpsF family glycosyltransferase [Dyadobacter sp. CY312]